MRLKQQSFVDKYIEVVILGVAALISLAIIYFYVVGTPYSVQVAAGKTATPAEVEKSYLDQGNSLKRAVERTEPPQELSNLKIPDYVTQFNNRYQQRLVKSDSFYAIVFGPPGIGNLGDNIGDPDGQVRDVVVVKPTAAHELSAQTAYHVLESNEALTIALTDVARAQYPDAKEDSIKALVNSWLSKTVAAAGKRDPRDFWGVTVAGIIKPQEWIEALEKVPAENKLPESWYEDKAQFISGIEIQRQTFDPKTGKWSDPVAIEPLPGAVSDILRSYVKQVQDAKTTKVDTDGTADLQVALVENLRFYQEDLVKPQFLPVKSHRPWTEPGQIILELAPADQQALLKLNQQITKYQSELRALIGRTGAGAIDGTKAGGTIPPRITQPFSEEGFNPTPGKTPPRGTPKTKQPGPGVDPSKKANPNEDRIKLYQTRLIDLEKQRDEILMKLHKDKPGEGGIDPSIDPSAPGRGGVRRPPTDPRGEFVDPEFSRPGSGRPRLPGDVFRPGEGVPFDGKLQPVKFWAHDVDVEAGKTYRYRTIYRVINPLFNKEDQLIAPDKPLAGALEQESAESEWTTPVTIEPPVRYFVEDLRAETSTVTWGIYRIYNGYRLHKQFTTRPGDPIGRPVEMEVKDDTGAIAGKEIVDLSVPQLMLDLKTPAKQAGAIGIRGPMTVLVADQTQGQVTTRDPVADREDPERIRLFNEATGALQNNPPAGAGAGGAGEFPGGRIPIIPPQGPLPR